MTYNETKQHIRDVLSGKSQVRNGEPIQTIACYLRSSQVLGRMQMQVNVSEYAKGIYTVRARFENGEEVSEKLVVE